MNILDVQQLSKKYAIKPVLDQAAFTIGEDEKVGFIGLNGSGKSTLFRIIASLESPDGGVISIKRGATIGYLPQDPVINPAHTIKEELLTAFHKLRPALERFEEISHLLHDAPEENKKALLEEHSKLSHQISEQEGWNLDHKLEEVLSHLSIKGSDRNEPGLDELMGNLSGGMKKRVALAKLVLESPSLLLLDEPTNHLDADTVQWLEDFLIGYHGAVMLITHDRYFLDRVVSRIIEIDRGKLYPFPGNYTEYLVRKAELLNHENKSQSRLITLLRNETAWIMRGARARGTKSKSRIERYGTLQSQVKGPASLSLQFDFKTESRLGDIILELQYLSKSFGKKSLFKNLLLSMKKGDRIGIIGRNGSGKTTLLKIILKEEFPTSGSIVLGNKTKIAYFDQHRESLDPNDRVEEALGEGLWLKIGEETRLKSSYLESFLFSHSEQKKIIRTLSGGEKARLSLAKLMLENANFLLLDEPTNDLDIPSLQLLDEALIQFAGCVLMVTHDRYFLDKVATGILSFEQDGTTHYIQGNYQDFLNWKKEKTLSEKNISKQEETPLSPSSPKKGQKKLSFKEERELEILEKEIGALEERKTEIEKVMGNPAALDREAVTQMGAEFKKIESDLLERVNRWEALETKKASFQTSGGIP